MKSPALWTGAPVSRSRVVENTSRSHEKAHADIPSVSGAVGHRDLELPGPDRIGISGHEVQIVRVEDREMAVAVDVERTGQRRGERWHVEGPEKRVEQFAVPIGGA